MRSPHAVDLDWCGPADRIIGDLRNLEFGVFDKATTIAFLATLQRWRGMIDALELDNQDPWRAPASRSTPHIRPGRDFW